MNYPRTLDRAGGGITVQAMPEEGIDEGPRPVARRGMDHHSRRLVDHDQVFIFVDDVERYLFGLRWFVFIRGANDRDVKRLARRNTVTDTDTRPIREQSPRLRGALNLCPRDVTQMSGEELVDALALDARRNDDTMTFRSGLAGRHCLVTLPRWIEAAAQGSTGVSPCESRSTCPASTTGADRVRPISGSRNKVTNKMTIAMLTAESATLKVGQRSMSTPL